MNERMTFTHETLLLIAAPMLCNNGTCAFNSWPKFQTTTPVGNLEHVQLMFLNCANKNEILPYLQKVITDLKDQPDHQEITDFFVRVVKNINDKLTHPIHQRLRECAEKITGPHACSDDFSLYVQMDTKL